MRIVLNEEGNNVWSVGVEATNEADTKRSPTTLDVVRILHGVTGDMLRQLAEESEPEEKPVIQLHRGALKD